MIGSLISSCVSGSPGDRLIYTEPDLSCRPLKEIIAQYPDCEPLIDRALQERSEHIILELSYCYDTTIQLLEDSYSSCNAPLSEDVDVPATETR